MKTFEAFVLTNLEDEYNIVLELWDNGKYLELSRIEVPKGARGTGVGTEVMEKICAYADEKEMKIYLTPSTSFGATSKSRLEEFYKGFGFVNKPKDDFSNRNTMVRFPGVDEGKKPKSLAQKIKGLNKKLSKISSKGEQAVNKMKEIQAKQKEGEAQPSDKLTTGLLKTQAQIANADMQKTSLKKQELAMKQKIKTAKDAEKAKKKVEKETEKVKENMLRKFSDFINEAKKDDDDPCWDGYEMIGMKKKGKKEVPNCVPVKEAEETYKDYPAAAKKNAKMAIDWKEKYGRDEVKGGTEVGWQRAHQLAKGEALSRDVVSRMAQFNRHRKNSKLSAEFKDEPWKDNGYIAWLIWGGDEGVDWAIAKMEEIKKSEETNESFHKPGFVKLFEEFKYEKEFESEYAKKVAWIMKKHDIHATSGGVTGREKELNISTKGNLYLNYATLEEYNDDKITVPDNVPILNYGGTDKEAYEFLKNKNVKEENVYNKIDLLKLSGDKVEFAKIASKFSWLPKTVFTKKEALDGAVGFPVIAKVKDGHSGLGIQKFDTAKELEANKEEFDLYCQFIDFEREYRVMLCRDQIILVNERVPKIEDDKSIRTKEADEKISFSYVYQDMNKIPIEFFEDVDIITKEIKTFLDLDLWALDIVVDTDGKMWIMETSSATGLGSVKMVEVYKAMYEDFYGEPLDDKFLEMLYLKYVVNGFQNYYPKYKREVESSLWPMDYKLITDPKAKDGYRYFFNLDKEDI